MIILLNLIPNEVKRLLMQNQVSYKIDYKSISRSFYEVLFADGSSKGKKSSAFRTCVGYNLYLKLG